MPLKWRVFRVVVYLHISACVVLLALSIYNNLPIRNAGELLNGLIFWSMLGIFIANGIINVFILERYYPDQKPGRLLNNWWVAIIISFIIILSGGVILTVGLSFDIFSRGLSQEWSFRRHFAPAVLGLVTISGIVVCYLQISLRSTIRHNYRAKIERFLE